MSQKIPMGHRGAEVILSAVECVLALYISTAKVMIFVRFQTLAIQPKILRVFVPMIISAEVQESVVEIKDALEKVYVLEISKH